MSGEKGKHEKGQGGGGMAQFTHAVTSDLSLPPDDGHNRSRAYSDGGSHLSPACRQCEQNMQVYGPEKWA